jgi:ectoine hydroxylase-related dioxygenase (phytanoyl-CoA dioxygenase family)
METSLPSVSPILRKIDGDGFAVIAAVFQAREVEQLQAQLYQTLSKPKAAVIQSEGAVVGARNLLQIWPGLTAVCRHRPLPALLTEILGPQVGLVRALYFDKPPVQTWSLPWHKDLTIAVRDNRRTSGEFRNPTVKAGVPHVEASRAILESMLIARIHLDDVTDENGPMTVIPGSHLTRKPMNIDEASSQKILCRRGDVLLIRPLVAHNSIGSQPGNQNHRRILHLEFAGCYELPDGYEWHDFVLI